MGFATGRATRLLAAGLLLSGFSFSASALQGSLPPSGNFDLSQWKLTLPSTEEVMPVELESGYQYAGVFFTDRATGGMVFRCPNIASHTTNSEYSRTEFREMLAADQGTKSDANNWTSAEGGALTAALRIDQVSTTGDTRKFGRVVIGQIHATDIAHEVVRLHYTKKPTEKTGRIYAAFETPTGGTSTSPDLISNANGAGIALGEKFRYYIALKNRSLHIVIWRRASSTSSWVVASSYWKTIDAAWLGQNLYFKAGVYNQNNTGDLADYTQATFFSLTHTHPN